MRNVVLKNQLILGTVNAGAQAFAYALRDLGHFTRRWPDHVERNYRRPVSTRSSIRADPRRRIWDQERDLFHLEQLNSTTYPFEQARST